MAGTPLAQMMLLVFPLMCRSKPTIRCLVRIPPSIAHWSANGGSAEVVEEKEVDPDTLLTTMGLAAGSVVLVLLASLAL